MNLQKLLQGLVPPHLIQVEDMDIKGVSCDSREIKKDFIFVAISGFNQDGAAFIPKAIENGAVAVVAEKNIAASVPVFVVHNARLVLALLANRIYASKALKKLAVTGTNGKTSVAYYTQHLLNALGTLAASIGTLGVYSPVYKNTAVNNTTFDPVILNQFLQHLDENDVQAVCLEASSVGFHQYRLAGLSFEAGAFTNFTQDHLDYHHTMEAYFAEKLKIFEYIKPRGTAVLNADMPEIQQLQEICMQKALKIFSIGKNGADLKILNIEPLNNGQNIKIDYKGTIFYIHLNIVGDFQVYNVLMAVGLCTSLGYGVEQIMPLLKNLKAPSGRLEIAGITKNNAVIYVDYAHTPDALERVLTTLRPHTKGKLKCLFGCGGNRDALKRPIMGEIANKLADSVYITDDNPRNEDPALIRQEILKTCPKGIEIENREKAIQKAIAELDENDVLVLAGKGHEDYQIIAGEKLHFSDKEMVEKYLK